MKKAFVVIGLSMLLAACPSKTPPPTQTTTPPVTSTGTSTGTGTTTTGTGQTGVTGINDGRQSGMNPLKDPNNILSKRIIYFEYDQDSVKSEYTEIVQAHARFLSENPGRKIRLEGHADERGSREYNMALGQRRAEAVRRATSILGVGAERMETISFGEDKPRATGQDEAAWAQNRRVEIVYDDE